MLSTIDKKTIFFDNLKSFHVLLVTPHFLAGVLFSKTPSLFLILYECHRFPGINEQRADIIISGAAIVETFMEEQGLSEIRISKRGLREGLLVDYILKSEFSYMIT